VNARKSEHLQRALRALELPSIKTPSERVDLAIERGRLVQQRDEPERAKRRNGPCNRT
jgi:hypothetical protein